MTVSIVLLTVDRLDFLRRCVESVYAHTRQTRFEWVFVLNGASEDVRAYVEALPIFPPNVGIQIKSLGTNEGVTPGRNAGIEMATGDLVLFLDDDAWVSEDLTAIPEEERGVDWLGRMVRYFDDPKVGVVGQSGSYINPRTPGVFWQCKDRGVDCDVVQGYCFLFRRSLGLLDPAYGRCWHEESDKALEAKSLGYRVINAGYIGVTHYGSASGDDGTYAQKIDYLFRKWKPRFKDILVPRAQWQTSA